jgi:membrane protease YdiL (CAAX protease family)
LLALLALGIAPGFGEEMLFRGFLQRGLSARLGPLRGVALAAALFALAHLDPIHSSVAFVLGAYLGVVTQLAGSIRTAIVCHVLNNTLGILAPALGPYFPSVGGSWTIPALMTAGPAALLYATWRCRVARRGHRQQPPPGDSDSGYSTRSESPT